MHRAHPATPASNAWESWWQLAPPRKPHLATALPRGAARPPVRRPHPEAPLERSLGAARAQTPLRGAAVHCPSEHKDQLCRSQASNGAAAHLAASRILGALSVGGEIENFCVQRLGHKLPSRLQCGPFRELPARDWSPEERASLQWHAGTGVAAHAGAGARAVNLYSRRIGFSHRVFCNTRTWRGRRATGPGRTAAAGMSAAPRRLVHGPAAQGGH